MSHLAPSVKAGTKQVHRRSDVNDNPLIACTGIVSVMRRLHAQITTPTAAEPVTLVVVFFWAKPGADKRLLAHVPHLVAAANRKSPVKLFSIHHAVWSTFFSNRDTHAQDRCFALTVSISMHMCIYVLPFI